MPAEVNLHVGSEPPQTILAGIGRFRVQKGGFREVHLPGDGLHPGLVARMRKDADGGGVPREGAVGEGVDLNDRRTHADARGSGKDVDS